MIAFPRQPSQEDSTKVVYVSNEKPTNYEPLKDYADLLTINDLMEITRLSAQTLRAACRTGELPSHKIGNRIFVPKKLFIQLWEGTQNATR